jgi:putative DNA primase/helicase
MKKREKKKGPYPKEIYKRRLITDFKLSDAGNAERLAQRHGENIRYVHDEGKFRIWNGSHWAFDCDGEISRRAVDTVREALKAAADLPTDSDRSTKIKFFAGCDNRGRLENMVACVRSIRPVTTTRTEFDQKPMLFNVMNGTIDLTTQKFLPHSREDMLTQVAPVEYKENADCPKFKKFLADIFQDKPEAEQVELIAFLQRAVGYTLTGVTSEQVCFMLWGDGQNGKGVLLQLLLNLTGDYGVTIPYDMLISKNNDSGSGPRDGVAQLYSRRFAGASEGEDNKRLHESKLKMLVAPDGRLRGCFLYQEPFEFVNTHKLWMATNYEPIIRGTDEGIWRRIRRIDFTHEIPAEKRILDLEKQIWAAESSGILNWALEGVRQWLSTGLNAPDCVVKATKEYRAAQNGFARFAKECLEFETQSSVMGATLYNTYKIWARTNTEFVVTGTKFAIEFEKLKLRGTSKAHTRMGAEYRGIKISPKAQQYRVTHQQTFDGDTHQVTQ